MLQGNERHSEFSYPDEQYNYFFFAERFGWTPQQVDEQPGVILDYMMAISAVVEEVKAEQMNDR